MADVIEQVGSIATPCGKGQSIEVCSYDLLIGGDTTTHCVMVPKVEMPVVVTEIIEYNRSVTHVGAA